MALNFCNNNSLSAITSIPAAISGGGLNLISTQTASSSSSLSFTTGIDSTYKEYVFKFYNIHPATNDTSFMVNFSTDGGSNYNVTKTTTAVQVYHGEDAGGGILTYATGADLAQGTGDQYTIAQIGNGNDESGSGSFHLFDPSSTTFVKHFIARGTRLGNAYASEYLIAGYGNTTSAIDAVRFNMSSGNIDSGVIKLYGVS